MQVLNLQGMSCENLRMLIISWPSQLRLPVQALAKASRLDVVHICNAQYDYWRFIDMMPVDGPFEIDPFLKLYCLDLIEAEVAAKVLSSAGFEFRLNKFGNNVHGLERVTRILRNRISDVSADHSFSLAPARMDPALLVQH